MCKMKAERIIKEILMKTNCRFLASELEDGLIIVRFIDVRGEYQKGIFPYRFMNEQDIENMVTRLVF